MTVDEKLGIPVLIYHHIVPNAVKKSKEEFFNSRTIATSENLDAQLRLLRSHGYKSLDIHEFEEYLNTGTLVNKKSFIITFDDGLASLKYFVAPILRSLNFKAIAFLISGRIRQAAKMFDPYEIQYISKEEISDIQDVIDIAGHSHNFHNLELINKISNKELAVDALISDIIICQNHVKFKKHFSLPFGVESEDILRAYYDCGVDYIYTTRTTHKATLEHGKYFIGRTAVYDSTDLKSFSKIFSL